MLQQNESFSDTLSEDLKSFFDMNIGSTEKIFSVWEASKAYISGKIITHSSKVKKEKALKENRIDKEIRNLARHCSDN